MQISKHKRKAELEDKLNKFFDENYLDIQGLSPGITALDESYLAKVLTKLAIGSATVWWSLLELKDLISHFRNSRRT